MWYNKNMKQKYNTEIVKFALEAHGDQQYGDMPYIVHLMLVSRHFQDPTKQAIALLHDVLEDTDIRESELFFEFGAVITHTIVILTRRYDETYFEYIERIKLDSLATEIKIADLEENIFMSKYNFSNKDLSQRYEKALEILKGEDDGDD